VIYDAVEPLRTRINLSGIRRDSWVPDDSFVDDWRVLHFCQGDILDWYRRNDDEADGEERAAVPTDPAEYQDEFDEWLTNVPLFRYCGQALPVTPTKALPLLSERCFFAPMFFWLRGRFINPWRDLAVDNFLDMSDNTEPETSDALTADADDALGS
jgi:hypothetical protein